MPKYTVNDVKELTTQAIQDLIQNSDNWTDFLRRASHSYKYSFREQLMIVSQKPNATACAEFDVFARRNRDSSKNQSC